MDKVEQEVQEVLFKIKKELGDAGHDIINFDSKTSMLAIVVRNIIKYIKEG